MVETDAICVINSGGGQPRDENNEGEECMSDKSGNPTNAYTVPSVSITTARTGASSKANVLEMRRMQERAYDKRGEQYLLIKSPPASGKSRALMFIALSKLNN